MKYVFSCSLLCLALAAGSGQKPVQPPQPATGPGGAEYPCPEWNIVDSAQAAGGFWIYQPASPPPDTAPVVIFLHGFGCFNPMIYGKWILHLTGKGNVVIMPRYQDRLHSPKPREFTETASKGIRRALDYLRQHARTPLGLERPILIGHSYGGVLAANLIVRWEEMGIPRPAAALVCQPGTNIFRGGRLKSYEGMPADLKLLLVVAKNDFLVSRALSKQLFRQTRHLKNRDMLLLRPDRHGRPALAAGHRSCHATDPALDNGVRTFSAKYALFHIPTDAADFYGYWKLGDALINCTLKNRDCDTAFGGTPSQKFLGAWSDGAPVEPFLLWNPE